MTTKEGCFIKKNSKISTPPSGFFKISPLIEVLTEKQLFGEMLPEIYTAAMPKNTISMAGMMTIPKTISNKAMTTSTANSTANTKHTTSNDTEQTVILSKAVDALLLENVAHEDSFFICDLSSVRDQHKTWTNLLPRIKPYYGNAYV